MSGFDSTKHGSLLDRSLMRKGSIEYQNLHQTLKDILMFTEEIEYNDLAPSLKAYLNNIIEDQLLHQEQIKDLQEEPIPSKRLSTLTDEHKIGLVNLQREVIALMQNGSTGGNENGDNEGALPNIPDGWITLEMLEKELPVLFGDDYNLGDKALELKRIDEALLPALKPGEPLFTTDTRKLFVGNSDTQEAPVVFINEEAIDQKLEDLSDAIKEDMITPEAMQAIAGMHIINEDEELLPEDRVPTKLYFKVSSKAITGSHTGQIKAGPNMGIKLV